MRIHLVFGSPSKGERYYEADAVPRIDDTIRVDNDIYVVRAVEWHPDEWHPDADSPDSDVYVFAR